MNKIKSLTFYLLLLSSCNQKIPKEKGMADNSRFLDNGNFAFDITLKELNNKARLLFVNEHGIIVGFDERPYVLFADVEFQVSDIPFEILSNINHIKKIMLKPSLFNGDHPPKKIIHIAPWLVKFHNVEYLKLDSIKLENLDVIKNLRLKYLILNNVTLENRNELINEVSNLKTLKYIAHDNLFTPTEIVKIQNELPEVNVLSVNDFDQRIEEGDIKSD